MTGDVRRLVAAAAVLGGSLILAALVFGVFFYQARSSDRTIRVVGSATRPFVADIAKWRLTLSRRAAEGDVQGGYAQLRADVAHLAGALRQAGLPDTALVFQAPTAQPMWGQNGVREGYMLQQPLYVIGTPQQVEALALNPALVLRAGAALEFSQLEYFFGGIAELKHALLGAATTDARRRAEEIAESSDADVGDMKSARAGVFQITEPYSTEVSGFGIHSTATRQKEITVTVHADFSVD